MFFGEWGDCSDGLLPVKGFAQTNQAKIRQIRVANRIACGQLRQPGNMLAQYQCGLHQGGLHEGQRQSAATEVKRGFGQHCFTRQ